MFIAGASIACKAMMTYAVEHINNATDVLEKVIVLKYNDDYEMLQFEKPMRTALIIVYEQPNQMGVDTLEPDMNLLYELRLALTRLADATLMYGIANKAFRAAIENKWGGIMPQATEDNRYFAAKGLLKPLSPPLQGHLDSVNARYAGTVAPSTGTSQELSDEKGSSTGLTEDTTTAESDEETTGHAEDTGKEELVEDMSQETATTGDV